MAKKVDSKEVGLELGFLVFKFFLKSEYLHYGYFSDGLEADVAQLNEAQKRYNELIFSCIPEGVKTILDVGCGSGKMAEELIHRGYTVDCVSPSASLNKIAEELLSGKGKVYTSKFETYESSDKYDLIMFNESFQYIPIDESILRALSFLNKGGYILLADFFRRPIPGKHPIGGGHEWTEWERKLPTFDVDILLEKDITEETSKTIEVVNQFTNEVVHPVWKAGFLLAEDRFPLLMKLVKWKYRKKLAKMENKHFTNQRNGANFATYKKYVLCLLQAKT
ncbi:Methyltransferase domain-containing protein [Cyclobacterium xiamenense]|uniref:Methyltransferase domain-containing protein n=1 Tax=Cyclobacterium xiamenense TaxID=1297121 RepID=A0A1H6W132_9BACT|nr:class I SAM-dependent methyltransferase [Cyclobacterium xiamenense]SEJ05985.1 Methyltransferase domain-containing protein [Cyclobacterium xiamenense]